VSILFLALVCGIAAAQDNARPLRIICFGAHPDDCEIKVGGTAAKWAALGHKVKFVSVTNGDIGHYAMAGGPLAQRRTAEVKEADTVLGIESQVLDHHDGELMPTLEVRKEIIRLIRQWQADIVIAPRPSDYHPDHRYTSILVQDAAYMVAVPYICPDTPPLNSNPVFLYMSDNFKKPYPFQEDIAVDITDVMMKKVEALSKITSQFMEWLPWMDKSLDLVPKDPAQAQTFLLTVFKTRFGVKEADQAALAKWYGPEKAKKAEHAEFFEICEYGRQPDEKEIKRLFPFYE
jgi:LmbE family N-acetylglucosaminyl deacetylase